jgi:hypothetical protein
MTQALDPPSYTKKILITNKVTALGFLPSHGISPSMGKTTDFFVTLFESISYALHARPTALSRLNLEALSFRRKGAIFPRLE